MNDVRAAFADQARSCRALGSELTAAIIETLGEVLQRDQGAVARRVLDWPGDPTSRGDSVPLRLAGALHGLVLEGAAPDLARAYAARKVPAGILLAAIATHEARILDWLDRAPQTNEVARSAALIAGSRFALGLLDTPLPLAVKELGASGGLNLNFTDYALAIEEETLGPDAAPLILSPDWKGPQPGRSALRTASRRGVDLAPRDLGDPLRLRAYIWADQPERLARLDAALRHAKKAPPQVDQGDAAAWLEAQDLTRPGCLTLVCHTVAFQYFPPETQERIRDRLAGAGSAASKTAPLAYLSMEADDTPGGAALRLTLWDGATAHWDLGRADFHGRFIDWDPQPA